MADNGKLYQDVMDKLHFEPDIDERNITVSVKDNGVVVLGGKIKSYAEKSLAERAVEKIEQVRGVANELTVDLTSGYRRSDPELVEAALNILKWSFFIPHERIKVAVESGHVTLTGNVEYNHQRERAEKAVRDLYGVTYVTNEIKVKSSVSVTATEVKEKIIKEFERNARVDASNVQVEIEGSKITLKGRIRNFDEQREARSIAWSIPGISSVIDHMVIGR